jgi:RNA polymerase sigma factor (sigma-70 family)
MAGILGAVAPDASFRAAAAALVVRSARMDVSRSGPEPQDERLETQDLAARAHSGDGARFGELYERIAPSLYTWAEIRIRPDLRQWIDPGDVVQEVWCRAWKVFASFDPATVTFRYWVFRVAKNVLLEAFRKLESPAFRARANGGASSRALDLLDVPDSATAVSRRVAREESLRLFADWVQSLDEDDRMLLVHHGLEGLSQAEVAERLQLGREAVAKRWQRLLARVVEQKLPRELFAAVQ